VAGPIASKSVGGVSISYDVGAVTIENAGHWNGSQYGIQFYQLAMIVGAGVTQL
jgi:hypothetical protein